MPCNPEFNETGHPPEKMESAVASVEQNKAQVNNFLDALGNQQADRMMSILSDGFQYWVAGSFPGSGSYDKEAMKAIVGGIGVMFPEGLHTRVLSMVGEGNRVAVEAEGEGKTASGKMYDNKYHFLFEFEGDKIIKLREYMDTARAAQFGWTDGEGA